MFVSNANFVYTINLEVAIYYRDGAAPHLGTACLVQTSLRRLANEAFQLEVVCDPFGCCGAPQHFDSPRYFDHHPHLARCSRVADELRGLIVRPQHASHKLHSWVVSE